MKRLFSIKQITSLLELGFYFKCIKENQEIIDFYLEDGIFYLEIDKYSVYPLEKSAIEIAEIIYASKHYVFSNDKDQLIPLVNNLEAIKILEEINIPLMIFTDDEVDKNLKAGGEWFTEGSDYYDKGELNKASECFEKAYQYYQKAIEIDPDNSHPHSAYAWNRIGNIYYYKGEHDKENEYYNKAIEINPEYADSWYNKACVESIRNNFKKSLEFLKSSPFVFFVLL